jgi:predicted acyltransferase
MNQRYYSLDVFRGATVALMILVNNPGSWGHIFPPLKHAPWHGCTPTDLVFPFFLFAVGNAMAFVMPRLEAAGDATFWRKVLKRTLIIFLIGLFLNWYPFVRWSEGELIFRPWEYTNSRGEVIGVRILGVLQRIALCYFFASIIIYYFKIRGAFLVSFILLTTYWLAAYWLGAPEDPYSLQGYFGNDVDKAILGTPHLYRGEGVPFDPEGLMSMIPAIVQVIFGYFVGNYIQQKGKTYEMLSNLFVVGAILIFAGFLWDTVFPINKKIWTSSYVLYTTGLATMVIGVLIYVFEFRDANDFGAKRWGRFFDVFGKNALFVFALSAFLPKTLALIRIPEGVNDKGQTTYTNPWNWLYDKVLVNIPGRPEIGSFIYALCVILLMWAICYWLDKKRIYIKV